MISRFLLWLKYRKHPCYIGNGEFEHIFELVDNPADNLLGISKCCICKDNFIDIETYPTNNYFEMKVGEEK